MKKNDKTGAGTSMSYYLKKFWGINAVVVLFQAALNIVAYPVFTWINIQILQAVIDLDFRRFFFWLMADLVSWGIRLLLQSLQTMFQGRAVRAMNNAVRRDMAATLLRMDYQAYHGKDRGEYLSWFTTGVNQIEQNAWNSFFSFTNCIAQFFASAAVLLTLHWTFLPIALATSVLMIIAPKVFEKRQERLGEACAQGQEAAVGGLKDVLGGYDVLRFFGRKDRFRGGVDTASEQMEKPAYRQTAQTGFIYGAIGVVNVLCQLIVLAYGGVLTFRGVLPPSVFINSGNAVSGITNSLNQLAYYRLCFSTSKPYFARIAVHDSGEAPERPQGPEPVEEAITVEHVDFGYGEKKVLADLSATFEKGKKYALTGPSGCGKSTLLKLILGWLPDYEGAIRFDGKNAKDYTPEQLQQQMSYIAQDVFLFNTTIRDNITLGEDFTDEEMEKALRDSALAGDIVNMPLGLDTPVGEEGSSLSGGQRQRVAIARALIHNRSILLVDEGTSALDQKNASIVEESLLANPELTLLLVSHHLTPARREQFDRVYELEPAA